MIKTPLEATSTVYMSGKGVYNLRRMGAPGIIGSVELDFGDAEIIGLAIRTAMEYAYDEGYDDFANARSRPNPYARKYDDD